MRKMLLLLFTATLFSASAQKTKKAAARFASLDAQLEKVRQDWKAAGFAGAGLKQYEGDHSLSGATVKVYTKAGNTLYVFVPGQPEYELSPQEAHKFALKAVSGFYVQFGLDEKDAVKEMTFIQPNGNFKTVRNPD